MKINIQEAKKSLINGGLVVFPTETVYGLGGDATNEKAINKIYNIKNRPKNNPLICHFKNIKDIEKHFIINDKSYELAYKFWPGPLTLILEKKLNSKISPTLSNYKNLVGCRIPKNLVAQKLLNELDFPIAAPSANYSTKLSSTKIAHLSKEIKKDVYILDGGESMHGLESTVLKVIDDRAEILRLGSITYEEIRKVIAKIVINNNNSKISPGQQKKHYSPNKPIRINVKKVLKGESLLNFGINNLKSNLKELNLSINKDLKEAAKNFYNYLHLLDNSKCKGIAVAPIPNTGLGKTINDRLNRASFS